MELNFKWLKNNKIFVIVSLSLLIVVAVSLFIFSPSSGDFLSALTGSSASNYSILVKFKNDPNIQSSSIASQIAGGPKIVSTFSSINRLNAEYNAQSSKKLFSQVQGLNNTYEIAVSTTNADLTVKDFKNDPNVEYARISEPNLEQKIKNEVDATNQKIAEQHLGWTAGYTLPEIMTNQDRMQLVGAVLSADFTSKTKTTGNVPNKPTAGCDLGTGKSPTAGGCIGVTCSSGQECNWLTGSCCTPDCSGKTCGDDGCCGGGSCGTCADGQICNNNSCCTPNCSGKACGASDGCGGYCVTGACGSGQVCDWDGCCTPNCSGKTCGWDGCSGTCGTCGVNQVCQWQTSTCCTTNCSGRQCGGDGCGGQCGFCPAGNICTADGKCVAQRSSLPLSWDWRNANGKNYITPVKDQEFCGSCWAFGALSAMEGEVNAYYNNPSINLDLSEQDIVSCANAGNCSGGDSGTSLAYVLSTGVTNESCFPYTSTDDSCSNKCSAWQATAWKVNNYAMDLSYNPNTYVPYSADDSIKTIEGKVFQQGPIVTYFQVYNDFFGYMGGIYQPTSTNVAGGHAVAIVGYGVDNNGKTYWICKNSWGTNWGEAGFFRIYAGTSGMGRETLAIASPKPPAPQQTICEDKDKDGYCNWGLGAKPSTGCPVCSAIEDCDDLNSKFGANCLLPLPPITVTSPNGGESWAVGSTHNITWTSTGTPAIAYVWISLYKGGTLLRNINYPSNTGTYSWTVPAIPAGGDYKIRIFNYSNSSVYDESDSPFTMTACTPKWACAWGPCVGGKSQWQAIDANGCGVTTGQITCPNLSQSCTPIK